MEAENCDSESVQDSLTGMSRAAKLFIRVDKEGFLVDSLAISDVVNFDCIESIVTSAKRIISLFTDVIADEVNITGLFYYKKRARSLRMNPVPLVTTTDGFRAIAEHPSGEIPLGIEWEKRNPATAKQVLGPQGKNVVEKRSRSTSPETSVQQKKRKLDAPLKYKTYMPSSEISSTDAKTLSDHLKHKGSQANVEVNQLPKEKTNFAKTVTESIVPELKKPKSADGGLSEDSGKRHPRQAKSNYHWTEDVSCEVILTYDGISERKKLKPSIGAIVQNLIKGNYNILRPDLHASLSMEQDSDNPLGKSYVCGKWRSKDRTIWEVKMNGDKWPNSAAETKTRDSRQTSQEILNSLTHREDDNRTITYLSDAKVEVFKVLSLLCMSKARFKDLLDWMKTLRLEEGNQGKYYLSERSIIGGGLRVMYDSDEQMAAKLNSIHQARSKAKEKTKLLYPVSTLQAAINAGKPGDKQFMIMVPSSTSATVPVTAGAKPAASSTSGEPANALFPTIPQPLIPVKVLGNQTLQPHPAWSKEVLNKPPESKSPLVSLLPTSSKTASSQTPPQLSKPSSRHPNILRNKSHFNSNKNVPPTKDPVPMHLYRSYKTGFETQGACIDQIESAERDDFDSQIPVIIKQEPMDCHGDTREDSQSSNDPSIDNSDDKGSLHETDDLNMGIVIKSEPFDDYGT